MDEPANIQLIFMIPKEISSLQHPIVKHLGLLRKSKSYRQENQSVCIVGNKMIHELSLQQPFLTLLVEKNTVVPPGVQAKQIFFVTPEILKKISGVQAPESLLAEIPLPVQASFEKVKLLLVLDRISDPGNLGTLLRSAKAFHWDGVFVTQESCDPFNEKALRSAKGATFSLPLRIGTWEEFEEIAKKNHLLSFLADIKGPSFETLSFSSPLALVLSNESKGSSSKALSSCKVISIPMEGEMESLNVAMAGSILLYQIRKKL